MANLQTVARAEGYALALEQLTGLKPAIIYTDSKAIVKYTKDQQPIVKKWLIAELDKKRAPDSVQLDLNEIVLPVLLQKITPYILLSVIGGYIILKKR